MLGPDIGAVAAFGGLDAAGVPVGHTVVVTLYTGNAVPAVLAILALPPTTLGFTF